MTDDNKEIQEYRNERLNEMEGVEGIEGVETHSTCLSVFTVYFHVGLDEAQELDSSSLHIKRWIRMPNWIESSQSLLRSRSKKVYIDGHIHFLQKIMFILYLYSKKSFTIVLTGTLRNIMFLYYWSNVQSIHIYSGNIF